MMCSSGRDWELQAAHGPLKLVAVVLFFKGFVMGLIFSVIMVAGTVWCVQVTRRHGARCGYGAALGISAGLGVWILLAVAFVAATSWFLSDPLVIPATRGVAAITLLYLSFKLFRARPARTLECSLEEASSKRILLNTFAVALALPMSFLGYVALCVAAGLSYHRLSFFTAPYVVAGALVGTLSWWCYIVGLATIYGERVPEPIALKSINKLNRLGGMLCLFIAAMTLAPLLVRG